MRYEDVHACVRFYASGVEYDKVFGCEKHLYLEGVVRRATHGSGALGREHESASSTLPNDRLYESGMKRQGEP